MNEELIAIIIARYLGEFEPATEQDATFRKNSQEIAQDLEDTITVSVDIISAAMISNNYLLAFNDDKPTWLMKKRSSQNKAITG